MPDPLRTGPFPAWLVWSIAIPVAIAAAFLAFFFLSFFLIAAALAAVAFAIRLWWLKRKLRRVAASSSGIHVFEGEYRLLYEERTVAERDPGDPGAGDRK